MQQNITKTVNTYQIINITFSAMSKMYKNYFQNFASKFIQKNMWSKVICFQWRVICNLFFQSNLLWALGLIYSFRIALLISNSHSIKQRTKQIESTSLVLRLDIFSVSIFSALTCKNLISRMVNGCMANRASQNA